MADASKLKDFVERIIRLEQEKETVAVDLKEVYAEVKAAGFDTRVVRGRIVKLMKLERADRQEQEATEDLYRSAVGIPPFAG